MPRPLNILIVEDCADDADLELRELRRAGFDPKWKRVETESDFLAEITKSPEIILSDYSLPQFSGLRAAELLRKTGLDIPFILISGTVGEDIAVEAMKQGVTDYLLKDRVVRLGVAVERALEDKRLRDERNQVEAARRITNAQYRTLFDHAPDGIIIANKRGVYLDASPSICRMLGYSREELIGLHASNIVTETNISNNEPASGSTKDRPAHHREWQFRRKDGSVFDAEAIITVMPDGNLLGMIRNVTERKQFEKEMRLAHEKMRQLLTYSPAVIYTLKIYGETITPVVVSDNVERMLGFGVDECSAYNWWADHLHPEDRDRVLATLQDSLTRDGYSMEYRVAHKDGSYRWVEDNNRLLRDADGKPSSMVGIWTDITERKRAEEVLRKVSRQTSSRKNVRVLSDLAVIFGLGVLAEMFAYSTKIFEPGLDKLVLKFRHNLDDLFVLPAILLLGFLIFSYRRWRDAQSQVTEQANIQETLRKLHGELEKRIQQRTVELANANDNLRAEITGHKRAQENLIEKTAFLEAQANSTMDAILVVNGDGKIILKNQRFIQLFQIPDQIARGDDDAKARQYVTDQIKNVEQFAERVQHLYEHPDEIGRDEIAMVDGKILDRYSSPVRDKAGKYYGRIWTFRDITDQRKLEEQFRQSQKMEAVGQLASGVAHDFNNVLAIIQMQSDVLKIKGGLTPAQAEIAGEISSAVQRAAALTRQLLMFSRKQTMQPRDLDLNDSINDMTKMLRRALGEHIQLQFKFSMQPLFIHADAGMMDQVLMNLAVNARDAMPKGGLLSIETFPVEFDKVAAAHSAQVRPGSFVCLCVEDTGSGIPPEILPKIFDPFFTTKDVGKGTGLGLATVFGIVQQHKGWINVDSEVRRGTTFRVYLPRLTKISNQKTAAPTTEQTFGGKETILVVEDESRLRASVGNMLSSLGYRVLEASDGISAQEVWKQNRDSIHLLLTDMVMPGGINGKELAEQMLKEKPALKVIYASGYSAEVAGKDFPLEEGVNFLTKPFQAAKLAQTIRARLDQ